MTANRERYNPDDYVTVPRSHLAKLQGEIERLRACIAEVREQAEYIVGADWPSSVRRLHARDTLAILDRHAADGGGDA